MLWSELMTISQAWQWQNAFCYQMSGIKILHYGEWLCGLSFMIKNFVYLTFASLPLFISRIGCSYFLYKIILRYFKRYLNSLRVLAVCRQTLLTTLCLRDIAIVRRVKVKGRRWDFVVNKLSCVIIFSCKNSDLKPLLHTWNILIRC